MKKSRTERRHNRITKKRERSTRKHQNGGARFVRDDTELHDAYSKLITKFVEPSGDKISQCVISSHGQQLGSRRFTIANPNIYIYFYSYHNNGLLCRRQEPTAICTRFDRRMRPVEIFRGSQGHGQTCPDYVLTPDMLGDFLSGAAVCDPARGYSLTPVVDITIDYPQGITLSNVINQFILRRTGIADGLTTPTDGIYIFHCLFCRN